MIRRNVEWIRVASKLKETTDKIAYLNQVKSKLSEELQILSDYKDSCGDGYEFKTVTRIGTINYKDIPELKDIDLSPYRGIETSYWKLSFKKQYKEIL